MPRFKTSKNYSSEKYYNFTGVLYQEHFGTKEQARDFLRDNLHCSCAVSVLHDCDVWTEEDIQNRDSNEADVKVGELKKLHYHYVLHYRSQQCLNTVRQKIKAFGNCIKCDQIDFMCRYFSHIDQPFKAQYSTDVACYMFDFDKHFHALEQDEDKLDTIAMLLCVNELHTFQSLLKFCYETEQFRYLTRFLMNKMYFIKEFISMINSKNIAETELMDYTQMKCLENKIRTEHELEAIHQKQKQIEYSCYLAKNIINKIA